MVIQKGFTKLVLGGNPWLVGSSGSFISEILISKEQTNISCCLVYPKFEKGEWVLTDEPWKGTWGLWFDNIQATIWEESLIERDIELLESIE